MEGAKLHLYWAAKLGNITHNNLAFGVMKGAWEQGLWNLHLWLIRDTEARKCMAGPALNEGGIWEDTRPCKPLCGAVESEVWVVLGTPKCLSCIQKVKPVWASWISQAAEPEEQSHLSPLTRDVELQDLQSVLLGFCLVWLSISSLCPHSSLLDNDAYSVLFCVGSYVLCFFAFTIMGLSSLSENTLDNLKTAKD